MRQKVEEVEFLYQFILVLAYFNSHYKTYEFSEIGRLMGMTYFELKKCMDYLLKHKLLIVVDNFIVISKKGEGFLRGKKSETFFGEFKEQVTTREKWNIDNPYIPIDFSLSE